jgi:signal peptidase II
VTTSARPTTRLASRTTLITLAVAGAVVGIDQLTKAWAVRHLRDGHTVDLIWTLRLNLTFNSGMAFSQGRGLGPLIGVVALIVIVVLLASLRRSASLGNAIALGLVIGGAASNILDRLFRSGDGFLSGQVVDFIDLQWYPVFNLADSAIVIGGILLLFFSFRAARAAR